MLESDGEETDDLGDETVADAPPKLPVGSKRSGVIALVLRKED